MEENLKRDVIREVRAGEGRILLHDEVEERPGVFSIIPIWEQVEEKDIMTPRDVYDLMVKEGYKVCHHQCTRSFLNVIGLTPPLSDLGRSTTVVWLWYVCF